MTHAPDVRGRVDPGTHPLEVRGRVDREAFTLDINITVTPGEVVAVIGPNGAGKSTLLRSIAGLQPLTDGTIRLGGRVVDDPATDTLVGPAERRVGVVFQDYRLFPHLSVADNIAFGPRAAGMPRRESRRVALAWCDRYGLADLADRRPGALSGGQSQRVALARALSGRPDVLLLDEPLAALDAGTRIDVRADLRAHLREVLSPTVLVTHDPLDALMLADRIVVLEQGRVTQQGAVEDVARRPTTEYVARLLGLNLLRGMASGGDIALSEGGVLHAAERTWSGEVLVAVRPDAISLHPSRPTGSARNVWQGQVEGLEQTGDRVRVTVSGPPTVLADITARAVADLGLVAGSPVWLSAKATELEVYPGSHSPATPAG